MLRNARIEKRQLIATLCGFAWFTTCMYIVCVANSTSDILNPNTDRAPIDREQLPDFLMRWISGLFTTGGTTPHQSDGSAKSPKDVAWVPELFVTTSVVGWLLRILMTRSIRQSCMILRRSFYITGAAYILRAISVISTVLPFPQVQCEDARPADKSPLLDAFDLMLMRRVSCGDVFFSGHTIVYSICMWTWITYSMNAYTTAFFIVHGLAGMISLLVAQYHYTIDVMVSAGIVGGIWWLYHHAIRIYWIEVYFLRVLPAVTCCDVTAVVENDDGNQQQLQDVQSDSGVDEQEEYEGVSRREKEDLMEAGLCSSSSSSLMCTPKKPNKPQRHPLQNTTATTSSSSTSLNNNVDVRDELPGGDILFKSTRALQGAKFYLGRLRWYAFIARIDGIKVK